VRYPLSRCMCPMLCLLAGSAAASDALHIAVFRLVVVSLLAAHCSTTRVLARFLEGSTAGADRFCLPVLRSQCLGTALPSTLALSSCALMWFCVLSLFLLACLQDRLSCLPCRTGCGVEFELRCIMVYWQHTRHSVCRCSVLTWLAGQAVVWKLSYAALACTGSTGGKVCAGVGLACRTGCLVEYELCCFRLYWQHTRHSVQVWPLDLACRTGYHVELHCVHCGL
jgi:hypothetical protein